MKFGNALSIIATTFLAQQVIADLDCSAEATGEAQVDQTASIIVLVVYGIEWFVLLFPNIVPLARPASSMLGAVMCMIVLQIAAKFGSSDFNAFCFIDYDTLALLFGLMLIVVMIDDSGILIMIEMSLEAKARWWFITKCCFVCAVLSAIVMNDTICLFFTAPILEAARKHKQVDDPLPYLLALSSNSNIGSALTTTGNPQNAMIASICETITYKNFLVSMILPCIAAWIMNWLILLIWYRHGLGLVGGNDAEQLTDGAEGGKDGDDFLNLDDDDHQKRKDTAAAGNTYRGFLVVGIVLMVVGFFVGINVAGLATGFGIVFMSTRTVIRSRQRASKKSEPLVDRESEKYLMQVDWPLLVLFTGLFIMISATVQTGYPDDFFRATFNKCKEDPTHLCTVLFTFMIVLFSNVISNVPLILLIKGYINNTMTDPLISRNNWMFISWVCTLAGNFILLGSAANLIVADQARKNKQDILSTINHGKFGIPSTFMCLVVGVPILLKTMQ